MTPNSKTLITKAFTFFFRLLYHSFAWSYDWVAAIVSVGQWNQWVLSAIPYLEGPRILELGFGPGHLQSAMLQRGYQVFGLDESPQMIKLAYSRLVYLNGYAKIPGLCRGRAQALPYPSDSFDNVIATFPSPYIVDPLTLVEIYRVLAPGGKVLIVLSAEFTSAKTLHRAAAWLFKATGQATQDVTPFTQRIRAAGFTTRTVRHNLASSQVLLIEAMK